MGTEHFVAILIDRMVNCARFADDSEYAHRVAANSQFYDRIRANLERRPESVEAAEAVEAEPEAEAEVDADADAEE